MLIYIPGYALVRSMTLGVAHIRADEHQLVLVRLEDAWQIALVVDRFDDGHVAVYVPGVPHVRAGLLYFMTPDRVKPLDVPMISATQVLRSMGVGSSKLLKDTFARR